VTTTHPISLIAGGAAAGAVTRTPWRVRVTAPAAAPPAINEMGWVVVTIVDDRGVSGALVRGNRPHIP